MDMEHTAAAKLLLAEHGEGTWRYIAMMIATVRGGGDPKAIDHWRGVMNAFQELSR